MSFLSFSGSLVPSVLPILTNCRSTTSPLRRKPHDQDSSHDSPNPESQSFFNPNQAVAFPVVAARSPKKPVNGLVPLIHNLSSELGGFDKCVQLRSHLACCHTIVMCYLQEYTSVSTVIRIERCNDCCCCVHPFVTDCFVFLFLLENLNIDIWIIRKDYLEIVVQSPLAISYFVADCWVRIRKWKQSNGNNDESQLVARMVFGPAVSRSHFTVWNITLP